MSLAEPPAPPPPPAFAEQRMLLRGVRWRDYILLCEALEVPGLRAAFCEGSVELMTLSSRHEVEATAIARLIELYRRMRDVPLISYGSKPFRREPAQRGAHPDECYCFGQPWKEGMFPDVVFELAHTQPLLDRLELYRGFGVTEIWMFGAGAFELFRRAGDGYERVERSGFLPELDFAVVARIASYDDEKLLHEVGSLIA